MICIECNSLDIVKRVVDEPFQYGDQVTLIALGVIYHHCKACGFQWRNHESDAVYDAAVILYLAALAPVLTVEQLKASLLEQFESKVTANPRAALTPMSLPSHHLVDDRELVARLVEDYLIRAIQALPDVTLLELLPSAFQNMITGRLALCSDYGAVP